MGILETNFMIPKNLKKHRGKIGDNSYGYSEGVISRYFDELRRQLRINLDRFYEDYGIDKIIEDIEID